MKKKIFFILFVVGAGILFTFYVLNKENIYAKEEYLVYAFQVGAFENLENANEYVKKLPSSIIIKENNLYKVYTSIYKNIDIVNKMLVYFENNNINIYLKSIKVSKNFYKTLDNYEKIILKSDDENIYSNINQSILNTYLESLKND